MLQGSKVVRAYAPDIASALRALCLTLITLAVCMLPAVADTPMARRTALVIGNSHYQNFRELPNAVNDANTVRGVLERANFEVVLGEDLDGKSLEATIRNFLRGLNEDDVSLLYYSGHAVQVAGQNYMLPIDATLASPYDLEVQAYNFNNLLSYMGQSSSLQIAILDACRDNPFKNGFYYVGNKKVEVEGNKGLAATVPSLGSLIVYSTAPDQVAFDGAGQLSPFSAAFADQALTPGVEVRELVTRIRNEVIKATSGRQVPWDVSSLTTSFYLVTPQDLLLVADATEVRLPPAGKAAPLNIPVPISSGLEPLTISLTKTPERGELTLDGKAVDPAVPIKAEQLAQLVYQPDPASSGDENIDYSVTTSDGRVASSSVKIMLDPQAAPPESEELQVAMPAGAGAASEEKPQLIAMAADVGTGFIEITGDWGSSRDINNGWLRLSPHASGAQVALDEKILSAGDLVNVSDVGRLSIRPSISKAGETVDVAFLPASPLGAVVKPLAITVSASVNECDRLAGEPLDIQGVTAGVLPNEIDVAAAKSACRQAVTQYPDVGRFKFEYARALYADGQFDDAVKNLKAAYDQGHVRAGQLIGRFHQLGLIGARDPAKAIPYYEAGAKKGDPYAQYALARALISGNGTKADVERGMALLASSAESGHTYAMNQLGAEYRYGQHTQQDPERALTFFRKSVEREDVWGMVNLGLLYRDGIGVEKDPARAMDLFIKADQGGQPAAGTLVALMMRNEGKGTPAELLDWFRKSAARGDAWGAFYAADLVAGDPSLAKDAGEAVRLLALSASQQTNDVSDRAKAALDKIGARDIARQVQETLIRMGQPIGGVDGVLGQKSRNAAVAVLGRDAPSDPRGLLMQLIRKEWISTQPRLDML